MSLVGSSRERRMRSPQVNVARTWKGVEGGVSLGVCAHGVNGPVT